MAEMNNESIETAKHVGDYAMGAVAVGSLLAILPQISALLSVVWFSIRIAETDTGQKFIQWFRNRARK